MHDGEACERPAGKHVCAADQPLDLEPPTFSPVCLARGVTGAIQAADHYSPDQAEPT